LERHRGDYACIHVATLWQGFALIPLTADFWESLCGDRSDHCRGLLLYEQMLPEPLRRWAERISLGGLGRARRRRRRTDAEFHDGYLGWLWSRGKWATATGLLAAVTFRPDPAVIWAVRAAAASEGIEGVNLGCDGPLQATISLTIDGINLLFTGA
jgi:hypothetical protein